MRRQELAAPARPGDHGPSWALGDRRQLLDAEHRRVRVRRHRSLVAHWAARWLRAPRPAWVEALPPIADGQLGVTFAGHATALLRYAGVSIVTDPLLARWIGPVRREVEPGLTAADLADVDAVVISGRRRDQLHLPTLRALPRRATVILPPGGDPRVSRLGFARVVELGPDASVNVGGATVTAVGLPRGAGSQAYYVHGAGPSALFVGDGAYDGSLAELGRNQPPDLALLPIGGFAPASFRDRHSSPLDALAAFEDLRARLLVPVRFGAFPLSYEHVDEPRRWLEQLVRERGLERYACILRPGQSEILAPAASPGARSADAPEDVDAGDIGVVHGEITTATDRTPSAWAPPVRVIAEVSAAARLRLAGPLM